MTPGVDCTEVFQRAASGVAGIDGSMEASRLCCRYYRLKNINWFNKFRLAKDHNDEF